MFEGIKVGDLVLVAVDIQKGLFDRDPERFYCKVSVSKITPKRFTANGKVYHKVDGTRVEKSGEWEPTYPPCKPYIEENDQTSEKVKTSADKILDLTEARRKKVIEILSQKGGLKKADKDTLIGLFNGITKEISGEIPFYTDMVKKSAERMVMESRADAEAFVTNIHAKLGSTILNNPEAIKLLLEDKSDES